MLNARLWLCRPPGREEALPALGSSGVFPPRGRERILLDPVLLCAPELGEGTGSIPPDRRGHRLSPALPREAPWLECVCFAERR